ncbi:DUF1622 domain-containing protein [Palleronia sp. KMU-117]|uniref:DUF1622 domain-containing protein n=1 Tax=Palleronia sp. KMU-117 TaxID=3434108 RepID=UPI003D7481BC
MDAIEGGTTGTEGTLGPLTPWLEGLATLVEVFALIILISGLVRFSIYYIGAEVRIREQDQSAARMDAGRVVLSRYILSALEVFIVSDIIRTVLFPTLESLAILGALVAIRSTISFFLDREMREIEHERIRS